MGLPVQDPENEKLAVFLGVALDGQTPPELDLPPLNSLEATLERVASSLGGFLAAGAESRVVRDLDSWTGRTVPAGTALVYLTGHAWLQEGRYTVAAVENGQNVVFAAEQLLSRLPISPDCALILVVDTCHAAAIQPALQVLAARNLVALFASAEHESATSFPVDRVTRLGEEFSRLLTGLEGPVDFVEIAVALREELASAGVLPAQTVSYWVRGASPRLSRRREGTRGRNPVFWTRRLIMAGLVSLGLAAGIAALLLGRYYWGHTLIDIDTAGIAATARGSFNVTVLLQEPSSNGVVEVFRRTGATETLLRLAVPAGNVVVKLSADYADGGVREVCFHLLLQAGLGLSGKRVRLSGPNASAIAAHPGMAFVSPPIRFTEGGWGESPQTPFWIDIFPVRVRHHREQLAKVGEEMLAGPEGAVLPAMESRARALEMNPPVESLAKGLLPILEVFDAASRPGRRVEGSPEAAIRNTEIPCDDCPAPMTLTEARNVCGLRGMRLPTAEEWRLAAGGADGRRYPWGNKEDGGRANVVGLPLKGEGPFWLKPVDRYPRDASPYGVRDLVGNAGDWVESGRLEGDYAGGTFLFDWDGCTVATLTPNTEPLPNRPITCRCVSGTVPRPRPESGSQ